MSSICDRDKELALVERMKQNERAAFDILVSLYQQRGLGIAYHFLGNLEDARDVLQEAFIKVYTHIHGFKGKSQFYTWFYRIVVNCSLDFLRKRKTHERIFLEPFLNQDDEAKVQEIADNRFDPSKEAMAKELGAHIEERIARLSERQRVCFVLKHQEGLKINEISEIIKCRPSTVKVHIFRAVENLRRGLARYHR